MEPTDCLENLPPSAQLALRHAQANHDALIDAVPEIPSPVDTAVPSAEDPVVVDNTAFAEPIIAGDIPVPIGRASPVSSTAAKEKKKKEKLDLSSEAAFPSLSSASSAPRPPALSAWSASSAASSRVKAVGAKAIASRRSPQAGSRVKVASAASAAPPITEMLELPASQQIANLPNKPLGFKSSADVISQVMAKTGTNIIASTNRSGTTTFLIQGAPIDVSKAKRELVAGLVVKRTVEITVPAPTRRFIIGAKGANLKQIEAKSGVRVNFPPRKDDEEEPSEDEVVSVTLVGDAQGIAIAKADIDKIVAEKTIKVDDIDSKYYLFLSGPRGQTFQKLEADLGVKIQLPPLVGEGEGGPITISGDKEKILAAKQVLEKMYAELQHKYRTAAIGIPKRQHKYLLGKDGESLREILEASGCTVELPPQGDSSDSITIRGPDERLLEGLTLVMAKAREVHVSVLDLVDMNKSSAQPFVYAKAMLKYLVSKGTFGKIESQYGVEIGVPSSLGQLKDSVPVEFVSKDEKAIVDAYKAGFDACRAMTPEFFGVVDVEPHLHRHIAVRHARQLQRIKSRHSVEIFFPEEKDEGEIPTISLVYDNKETVEPADQKPEAAKEALEAAIAEIKKIAADSSDFVSKTLSIPAEYHHYISGPKGTTLNAIVGGSESAVSVRLGGSTPDAVNVRGPSEEVKHVMAEINKVYDAVKRKEFVGSYATEFTISAAYSAHVIGKSGSNINKLKDELGVKIDISDVGANGEEFKSVGKKGSKNQPQVNVVIQGIQTNVEAAKERIVSLVDSLADQVTLTINVPKEFHRFLIGPNGRYVRKLEDKYNVYIKFPKTGNAGSERNGASDSAITVRGRKKDATAAKEELVELYEYEKEEQAKRKEREEAREEARKKYEENKSKN
ncbi:hypothetical protein BX666DRAFT_1874980 [Dichotomocladium elegans]|nr:hypothetical protein BX666DRAFT_1874980 [Dichotomocladium elegans]